MLLLRDGCAIPVLRVMNASILFNLMLELFSWIYGTVYGSESSCRNLIPMNNVAMEGLDDTKFIKISHSNLFPVTLGRNELHIIECIRPLFLR